MGNPKIVNSKRTDIISGTCYYVFGYLFRCAEVEEHRIRSCLKLSIQTEFRVFFRSYFPLRSRSLLLVALMWPRYLYLMGTRDWIPYVHFVRASVCVFMGIVTVTVLIESLEIWIYATSITSHPFLFNSIKTVLPCQCIFIQRFIRTEFEFIIEWITIWQSLTSFLISGNYF